MTFHSQQIRQQNWFSVFLFNLLIRLDRPPACREQLRLQSTRYQSQQGLTLIEALIAIMVITITVVAVTPPIFWATATRVQNQRAEQALSLAQGEIDRVRAIVERQEVEENFTLLPPVAGTESEVRQASNPSNNRVPAPKNAKSGAVQSAKSCSSTPDDGAPPSAFDQYVQVDINSDCQPDFLLQTFRSQGIDERGNMFIPQNAEGRDLSGFVMGVRVYSIVAKAALDANKGKVAPASLKGTTGLGGQLDRPLAVLYSTIVRSSDSGNLSVYRALCGTSGC
jgi:type II secretory pathway pseudopilin PulG